MLVAQSAMANLLVPPIKSLGPLQCPEMTKAYGFQTDERTLIVAWVREDTTTMEISLAGKAWRAVDLQGNELETHSVVLTKRPVYFVAEGAKPKDLPFTH